MILSGSDRVCEQARFYYYDYACGEDMECVPPATLAHIEHCRTCQGEVGRLKAILAGAEDPAVVSREWAADFAVAHLRLHFAYIDKPVECSMVKPFLPCLAISDLRITVPTPITVHIDQCRQCTRDFELIRGLNLTRGQLSRLSRLFANEPVQPSEDCTRALTLMPALVLTDLNKCDADVLRHFCVCPVCREKAYQYRESVCEDLRGEEEAADGFCCDAVAETDLFDYCLPYGLDPADDQYAEFRPALTSHVRRCPTCLGKMQRLHRTVYGILERSDSEVVTRFTCEEHIKSDAESEISDLYADWPIRVQVVRGAEAKPGVAPVPAEPYRKAAAKPSWLRPARSAAVAAAAVILAAFLLWNVSTARALDLGRIYEALQRIKNVHMSVFLKEEAMPAQEVWVSRTLNVKMLKTGTQCVLWDLNAKLKKSKDLDTDSIAASKLDSNVLANVARTMEGPLGLLPFNTMPEAPEAAQWQLAADETTEVSLPGIEIYDLTWTRKESDGLTVVNRWRGYIDAKTALPSRVERWEKRGQQEYKLVNTTEVDYPAADELHRAVKEAGF